jgi:TonB-linked SusC/RagA family outer membrane protein
MKKLVKLFSLFFVMTGLVGFAQSTVSGTVSDSDGLPLPGATVVVQGTSIGVTSDFDGNYSISASQGDVLVFSYVGYESQTVTVGTSSTVNVSLTSSTALEEVVVTGITSRERQRLTSNAVVVGSELIEGVAVTSPDQALMGRVAGLRIVGLSGTPGAPQQIRIRGEGSISGSNSPLFVIDGVPVNNGTISPLLTDMGILSMINAADIASITVLKDAASLAAYGARGSNGVVVITTKKGKAGKVQYNVQSQYGFQNYAMDERPMLTGNQRLELGAETIMNTYGWSKDRATNYVLSAFPGAAAWDAGGRVDGNWEDLIRVEDAPYQNYNISATGGNSTENFRVGVGYRQQTGTSIGTDFESVNGSVYYKKVAGKVTIETNNRVSNAIQNGIHEGTAYFGAPQATRMFMSPYQQPKNPDGSWNIALTTSVFNTPYLAEVNIQRNDGTRALSNNKVTYAINDKLKLSSRYAVDFTLGVSHEFRNPYHGDGRTRNGTSYQAVDRSFLWSTVNELEYNDVFGDNEHFVSALLRQSFAKNKSNFQSSFGENVAADGLYYVASFNTNESAYGSFGDYKELGYLALANYSYKDKYVVDLSFRNDGSSRFASGYRFGNFYSAGVAWNISNENFLADSNIVDNLKLRASYGETGNNGIGNNQYQSLFGYGGAYDDNGAVAPVTFGNLVISWETARLLDVGVDFSLFGDRFSGALTYYEKTTDDLLQSVPLSTTTGHSSQTMNIGSVLNKGVEFEFDAQVLKAKDFSFEIYGNVAENRDEVLRLAQDAAGNDINLDNSYYTTRVGHPQAQFYLRTWGGVDSADGRPYYLVGGDHRDGPVSDEVTYSYSAAQQTVQGLRLPPVQGGLGLRVGWKGLTVDANMMFAYGHVVFERWAWYTMNSGLRSVYFYQGDQRLMDRWQKPGDVTDVPKMVYSSSSLSGGSGTTSRFLYDGDFARLRDLTVNYTLPKSATDAIGFNRVDIFVKGLNLFTWTKDNLPFDPEVRASGRFRITTPPLKSISLGANLNF